MRAFLALALVDLGREREAVGVSLAALSRYLPRYNQSLARYANEIAAKPKSRPKCALTSRSTGRAGSWLLRGKGPRGAPVTLHVGSLE